MALYCQRHDAIDMTAAAGSSPGSSPTTKGCALSTSRTPRRNGARGGDREARATAGTNAAIKLVAGNSNPRLAEAIAAHLRTPLARAVVRRFADMEIFVEILENVRGADVFVVQSTSYPGE